MITVVIPLYNKAPFISRTLDSVAAQTYTDFEVVVVDDGSTDGSSEIVENHPCSTLNAKLKLIRQSNAGVSAARNRGIAEAQGEHIAFLDADDEWKPDYLATQMSLVEKYPQCDVFATNYEFRDEKGSTTPTIIRKLPFDGENGELTNYFEVASRSHPPLWTSAVMVRKSAIESVGGFPVGIKSGEDLLTWARLVARYRIAWSRKVLAVFFRDENSFNNDQKERVPESNDFVGEELGMLYKKNKETIGLKAYVGFWHKMRARIYIQKKNRKWALKECSKSMKYSVNIKIIVFVLLALLPYKMSDFLFHKIG